MQTNIFAERGYLLASVRVSTVKDLNASNLGTLATNVLKGANGVVACDGLLAEFQHVPAGVRSRVYINNVLTEDVVVYADYPVVAYDDGYARIGTTMIRTV